jgi:glycolate oxidase
MIIMDKESILRDLEEIVGKDFASNKPEDLFIYSQDPGASEPRPVDFVVMPRNVEEIQKIVKLANREKIPLIPMGGGLTLSGLILPVHRGIVMDMKRMDKILEINTLGRYAVLEAGVTTGSIVSYLNENHPNLQAPIPDAPTSATVAANVLIHGSGSLSQKYGHHSNMINGLEVVLPTGEIAKFGSCAISDYWFSKSPIPDLIGLFTSSFGTMGIVTKVSIKLYPKPNQRDIVMGLTKNFEGIPDLISKITFTEFVEDVMVGHSHTPPNMKQFCVIMIYITGNSKEEMDLKRNTLLNIFKENNIQPAPVMGQARKYLLDHPQYTAAFAADWRKGGGFEYVGSFIPLEKIPEAIQKGVTISEKFGLVPSLLCRIIGSGHAVMFSVTFPFNRADPDDMKNAREGLEETNKMVLEIGGIPWKTELTGQKLTMEKADHQYKELFKQVRNLIDPNGIMNPGNWEV